MWRRHPGVQRGILLHGRRLTVGTLVALLTACTAASESGSAVPGDPQPVELRDVPVRPKLSYTVEQRRAIGNSLLADLENARHEQQVLRSRTGSSALPPPPAPATPPELPPVEAAAPPIPAAPDPTVAAVREQVLEESDDGSLGDFFRKLVRRQPDPRAPRAADATSVPPASEAPGRAAAPGTSGTAEPPTTTTGRPAPPPDTPALDRFLDHLGGSLAVGSERPRPAPPPQPQAGDRPSAAPSPPATLAAPPRPSRPIALPARPVPPAKPAKVEPGAPAAAVRPVPAAVPFPPGQAQGIPPAVRVGMVPAAEIGFPAGSSGLAATASTPLGALATQARAAGLRLRVVGYGTSPALALERARSVARMLVERGAPADRLELRPAGPGDRVQVYFREASES